jgi:hypothetical protein
MVKGYFSWIWAFVLQRVTIEVGVGCGCCLELRRSRDPTANHSAEK